MKSRTGAIVVIVLMLCVLGALVGFLLFQNSSQVQGEEEVSLPTAEVVRGSIIDEVTGAAEAKGATNEKLKMAQWRNFKAFVAPLDERIPAGTPIVEYTNGQSLVAPYDLVVRSKDLPEKKGDELTEEHFVEVSRVDLLHVELDVHENDISRLAVGQPAQVTLGSDENKILNGTITKINQVGTYDATGSKYRVTIEVPNDGSALIGMSANVSIVAGEVSDVLTVPVSAINDAPDGSFVMVSGKDGSLTPVPVETGLSDGANVEVRGEIAEGDIVLLNESAVDALPDGSGEGAVFSFTNVG